MAVPTKQERRTRAAPRTRPRVLTNEPQPPPLSGRGRVRFVSFKGLTAQVGRFEEAEPMHTRMVQIVNGPGPARSLLWSESPGSKGKGAASAQRRPHHPASYTRRGADTRSSNGFLLRP